MSSTALKDAANQQNTTFKQFTDYLDQELGEIRTEVKTVRENPELSGETKQTIERMVDALNEQDKQIKELKALHIALNRTGVGGYDDKDVKAQASRAAFNAALRVGPGRLKEEDRKYIKFDAEAGIETKALYAADATTGGFLAVPEYVNDLIEAIVLVSDMHGLVDVRTTSAPYITIPKRTQTASAYRVAEQSTRTESQNPKFGSVSVFPYEAAALCLISRTDLDDAELDLGQFIMAEFAEQFAKLEGAEILNGTGNGQCAGIMNDPTVTVGATTAAQGVLDFKSFVTLIHSIKTGYRKGASFVFTTETLGQIRSLTDNQGRPLWIPFGAQDLPGSIYGYPYAEMPDMPQIANGSKAVLFGNFKRGYQFLMRKQVSIQTLMERYADQNAIGYLGYYRFGGTVKLGEAIKIMQVHS